MLSELAKYLSDNGIAVFDKVDETKNQIYIGQIDMSKDNCIGLYSGESVQEIRNIGFESYEENSFTILIHWSKNYETAEAKGKEIYDLFKDVARFTTANYEFWNIRSTNGKPIYLETRNDVYEFVINYLYKVNI